jgi:hypothetical protein
MARYNHDDNMLLGDHDTAAHAAAVGGRHGPVVYEVDLPPPAPTSTSWCSAATWRSRRSRSA